MSDIAEPIAARTPEFFAAVAALIAAAVLLIAAPFLKVFTLAVPGTDSSYSVDGWGRFQSATTASGAAAGHFTRFGIGYAACGIVFAVLAVLVLTVGLRPGRLDFLLPSASGVTIAACGVAAGLSIAAGLQMNAVVDSTDAALRRSGVPSFASPKADLSLGSGSWIALAGLTVGLLAILSLRWLRAAWEDPIIAAPSLLTADDDRVDPDADAADPFVFTRLPEGLPVPEDDGATAHLAGRPAPKVVLASTSGHRVALDKLPTGRSVLFVYPMTGRPGVDLPQGWDEIPGARGCTTEACGFRDLHKDLIAAGAVTVLGVSAQDVEDQREAVERLRLPHEMLSDPDFELVDALDLPTFDADGARYYARMTLVVTDGAIEHVFYPVFPPDQHADEVLRWLNANPQPTW
ncbi:MAG: peroxiredoxin [Jatrophihabitans sp.]